MEISEDRLMELARVAGLPVSWWDKAKSEGKVPPTWRELRLFANMIQEECTIIAVSNLKVN